MVNSIRKLLEKNKAYKFSSPYCKKYVLFFLLSLIVSSLNLQINLENHMKLLMLILMKNWSEMTEFPNEIIDYGSQCSDTLAKLYREFALDLKTSSSNFTA